MRCNWKEEYILIGESVEQRSQRDRSIDRSTYLSIHVHIYLSIYLSIDLSICTCSRTVWTIDTFVLTLEEAKRRFDWAPAEDIYIYIYIYIDK